MTLAAYVAENGLVGHHWEERPLDLANFICPSTGERQGQDVGVGGWRVCVCVVGSIGDLGIAFEMYIKKIANKK